MEKDVMVAIEICPGHDAESIRIIIFDHLENIRYIRLLLYDIS